MKKISVIIPIYNAENYIKNCLDSIKRQSFYDYEIICINDGSTDSTLSILNEYIKDNNNLEITLINKINEGASIARNKGFDLSKAEYIYFVDADDTLEKDCLKKIYNAAINNNADIVYFNANIFKENSLQRESMNSKISQQKNINDKFKLMSYAVWNKFYKKEFLLKYNIKFPEFIHTSEDNIFNEICHFYKPKYYILKDKLYNYTEFNFNSITSQPIRALNYEIESFKYIINRKEFIESSDELKIIILDRHIQGLLYYVNRITEFSKKRKIRKKIFDLLKYIEKNCGKYLLLKTYSYSQLIDSFKIITLKEIVKKLFSIRNSRDRKHKIITLLGAKLKIKREKKYDKQEK